MIIQINPKIVKEEHRKEVIRIHEGFIKNFKELLELEYGDETDLSIEPDDNEWDLTKKYTPNHACIWNSVDRIKSEATIITKDNTFAIVAFKDSNNVLKTEQIYRLEDLSYYKT